MATEQKKSAGVIGEYMTFELGRMKYAIELHKIREILERLEKKL